MINMGSSPAFLKALYTGLLMVNMAHFAPFASNLGDILKIIRRVAPAMIEDKLPNSTTSLRSMGCLATWDIACSAEQSKYCSTKPLDFDLRKFIPKLIKRVRNGFDVVIASRFEPGGGQMGVSKYRAFISRSANYFMKIFFPISGLKEYSCGFRAYRAEIIKEAISFYGNNFIQLKGLGFTCTLEKLVKLKLIGASFGEEPFLLRYDQKLSDSKMVSSVTTLGYLVMTFLYHWPWGGWRSGIKKKYRNWNISNDSL